MTVFKPMPVAQPSLTLPPAQHQSVERHPGTLPPRDSIRQDPYDRAQSPRTRLFCLPHAPVQQHLTPSHAPGVRSRPERRIGPSTAIRQSSAHAISGRTSTVFIPGKPILVVMDMQPEGFPAAGHPQELLSSIKNEIRAAMENQETILYIRYPGKGAVHEDLLALTKRYAHKYILEKDGHSDGSHRIAQCLMEQGIHDAHLRFCGIFMDACVMRTVLGLLAIPTRFDALRRAVQRATNAKHARKSETEKSYRFYKKAIQFGVLHQIDFLAHACRLTHAPGYDPDRIRRLEQVLADHPEHAHVRFINNSRWRQELLQPSPSPSSPNRSPIAR